MKKIVFLVVLLLIIPAVNAEFFINPSVKKIATFVSKYSSTSMDETTLDYFERLKVDYSVYIIEDSLVVQNSYSWKESSEKSDLIFVISLSEDVLNETNDQFCENLGSVLEKSKGIIFAGSSSILTADMTSCLYISYFDLAEEKENSEIENNNVSVTASHNITKDYELKDYSLGESDSIYVVVSPKNGIELAKVYGDPDGAGDLTENYYSFLTVWEGLSYRAASFGIKTSNLNCTNCLGWDIFDNLLGWVSDIEDIGFEIGTDKEEYFFGQRIYINVTSEAEMADVAGEIISPENAKSSLYFTGSGKEWNSVYLLSDEEVGGNYIINVFSANINKNKTIRVKPFDIGIEINNQTKKVQIIANISDVSGNPLEVENIRIKIENPKSQNTTYSYGNVESAQTNYTVRFNGKYIVRIEVFDFLGRTFSEQREFYFLVEPNMTLSPENITRIINEESNITVYVKLHNKGEIELTNVHIEKTGSIKDWITTNPVNISSVLPGAFALVAVNINVPNQTEGTYTGSLVFKAEQGEEILPVVLKIEYPGNLILNPVSWQDVCAKGNKIVAEFELRNNGKGNVRIESVNVTGELKDYSTIIEIPTLIAPGGIGPLKIEIIADIIIQDFSQTISGYLQILTSDESIYLVEMDLIVIENLVTELNLLNPEIVEIESDIGTLGKKIDVSDLASKLNQVKQDIRQVESSYNNEDYSDALNVFSGIGSKIESLKSDIVQKEQEMEQKKSSSTKTIFIVIGIIFICVIGFIVFKTLKKKQEASWLYDKWKK